MDKHIPFLISIIMFIIILGFLSRIDYFENLTGDKKIAYLIITIYSVIFLFVLLSGIYMYENRNITCYELKSTIQYDCNKFMNKFYNKNKLNQNLKSDDFT